MKVGHLIDSSGVELGINDSDLVTDFVVVAKVVGEDGRTYLCVTASEATDWVTQGGLLHHAMRIHNKTNELMQEGGDD